MKMQPSMMALMTSPTMFCMIRMMMAETHSSVTIRLPNPMVTWTFYGEEESGGEGVNFRYARDKIVSFGVQVAVRKGYEPPDHPEEEPAAQKRHGKNDKRVEPF
ncbi:hypothetical protein E3U43_005258 [Larimichthys crocea]|uniref:Uncharacterized protein n=1 Tax=Larimichthys crocea TaxID=215358 RepID=A0ACD3QHJ6_LARCR|nr:hypothetical protein E3U43_005258 [Larimichthys crocea]